MDINRKVSIIVYKAFRSLGVERDQIRPEMQLRKDIKMNEIDWILLLNYLEEKTNLEIKDNSINKLVDIQDLINMLVKNLKVSS